MDPECFPFICKISVRKYALQNPWPWPGAPFKYKGPLTVPSCVTSPFAAVGLAYMHGFKKIGLIGVDLVDHHLNRQVPKIDDGFRRMHKEFKELGVELVNLSPISSLQSLPYMEMERFLQ